MKILVNAISTCEGGSAQVLYHLSRELAEQSPHEIHVVLSDSHGPDALSPDVGIIDHRLTWNPTSATNVRHFYSRELPALAGTLDAGILFSLTNNLPPRSPCPTALLVQNAGHFSTEYRQALFRENPALSSKTSWLYKTYLVKQSIRKAGQVTVQTQALANAIHNSIHLPPDKMPVVIPHGPGPCTRGTARSISRTPLNIGYISKYGAQKNFDTVLNAMPGILNAIPDTTLHLTLDPNHEPNHRILKQIDKPEWAPHIINHGHVPPERIEDLYDQLDIFLFPSFCESFGMPMVEAMSRGLPVIIADTPVNREICDSAGVPFPPSDAEALKECVLRLIDDPGFYHSSSLASLHRSADFSWKESGRATLQMLNRLMQTSS